MGGKLKSSPIELLSRRNVGAVSWSGAENEENPGEMMVPVSCSAAGTEGGFEMVVEAFHQTVGLGLIGRGGLVRDVEVRAEGDPQVRSELRTTVRGDSIWHTETGDPVVNQSGSTVYRRGGGQGNGLGPTGSAINDGEEVGVTRRGGEGANQINVDVRESRNGKRNGSRPKMSMAVHFRSLAGEAGMAPEGNIFGKVRPDITGREEPVGSPGAWVSKSVNTLKENMAETLWDKGAKKSGDITEERCVTKYVGVNAKVRRNLESLDLRT